MAQEKGEQEGREAVMTSGRQTRGMRQAVISLVNRKAWMMRDIRFSINFEKVFSVWGVVCCGMITVA
jgi:hypothetical protein